MNQNIKRFPQSSDGSLRAWSAADELVIEHCPLIFKDGSSIAICHDRFGALAANLSQYKVCSIVESASQLKAIQENRIALKLDEQNWEYKVLPKTETLNIDSGVLIVPKSTELWSYYLSILANNMSENGTVLAGFMTRHFTNKWLGVASKYFGSVEQSKAKKKARVLVLKKPIRRRSLELKQLLLMI